MDKYLLEVFKEFRKATGSTARYTDLSFPREGKENVKKEFISWLDERDPLRSTYGRFLKEYVLDDLEQKGIIELDKGILNSVIGGLEPFLETTLAVTPYSHTFDKAYRRNHPLGRGCLININSYMPHINCDIKELLNIEEEMGINFRTIITQLPLKEKALGIYADNMMDLVTKYNKLVIVGSYGYMDDKNKDEQYHTLEDFQEQFKYNRRGVRTTLYSSGDYEFYRDDIECDVEKPSYCAAVKIFAKNRNN